MSLDESRHNKSLDKNPIAKERILEIQKIAKHPLIMIMGAHGVGKDSTIQRLLEKMNGIPKMKRATSRERKERDEKWDFTYYTPEEMEKAIESGEVLFAYDSDRNDGSKYWLLYEELKKLEHQSFMTVIGIEWLEVRYYVPHITCCLVRDEKELIDALQSRTSDPQTQKNIRETKRNLAKYLDKPWNAKIIIENQTGNIDETVGEIKSAIEYFEKGVSSEDEGILDALFDSSILAHVTSGKNLIDFRQNLLNFLIDEKNNIKEEKVSALINFMFLKKFNRFHFHSYLEALSDWSNKRTEKNIYEEIALFYRETAHILYELWRQKDAKKIMLQIGERDYAFPQKDEGKRLEKQTIDTEQCLANLKAKYNFNYREGKKIVFVENSFEPSRLAARLAEETLHLLLITRGIEIVQSTSFWGEFKIKLLEPYDGIEYIECQIIRDRL